MSDSEVIRAVDELHLISLSPQGDTENFAAITASSSDNVGDISTMEEEIESIEWMREALRDSKELVKMKDEHIAVMDAYVQDLEKELKQARAETVSVQDTLQSENWALQLELQQEKEKSDMCTRELGEEIMHLKNEVTESQEVIRNKDGILQELTQAHTENLTVMQELKDAQHYDQETVKAQAEQITVLKSDALNLLEQVQEARAETVSVLDTLQSDSRALRQKLQEVKQKSDMCTRELGEEIMHLKNEVTESQEVIRNKDGILQELTQAHTQNLTVMQELKDARHYDQETVKAQAEQITVLKSDVLDLQRQVQEARAETVSVLDTLQSAERACESECDALHNTVHKYADLLCDSQETVKTQNEQITVLRSDVQHLLEQVLEARAETVSVRDTLQSAERAFESECDALHNTVHKYTDLLRNNQETVKTQNQQITVLRSDVQHLLEQVLEARAETVSVRDTLQSENWALQLELQDVKQKGDMCTRELGEEIMHLKNEVTESQEVIRNKDGILQELTQAHTQNLTVMQELKDARHYDQETVKAQAEQITVLKSDVLNLQKQVQEARAETVSVLDTLQSAERAFESECDALHNTVHKYTDLLRNNQETVKTQNQQITVLRSDVQHLLEQVLEARAETVSVRDTLQSENWALQLEIQEVKEKSDMCTRELGEEIMHLKNEVTESQEVIRNKDGILQELTQAQTQNLTVMQELKDARHYDQETVKTQTEQITVLKSDVLDLQKQVQEARAETVSVLDTLQSAERAFESECDALHNTVHKYTDLLRNNQETVKTQNQQITVLRSDVQHLLEQVLEARAETVSVRDTLQSENWALQLEIQEVKEKSDMCTRELGEEIMHLKNEVTESQEVIRNKDGILQELTQAQTHNLTVMQELKDARHYDQETVKAQAEQITVLKSDALNLQKQVQEARAETVSVLDTLQSAERAFQLQLCEERQKSATYTRELEKKILTLKVEIRESQDAIREKEITIQELTHFESLAESKDAEIKDLRFALCSGKNNEISLTGQNKSLINEVARLEAETEIQTGENEDLKKAVRALQHQIVEAKSSIWTNEELVRKQSSQIADLKELIEFLISDLKQSNSDLKTQLDMRQEEESLAGVSFREECWSVTENLDQLDVAEEQVAPAAEASAVEVPAVEVPAVEVPAVEAPDVESPNVEAPDVEALDVNDPEVEAPAVDGQTSSQWRRCARGLQRVGVRVAMTTARLLVPLSIVAAYNIWSASYSSQLAHFYDIDHITPPPF